MTTTGIPAVLHLPGGVASLVPGSYEAGQPRYERDGVVLDVDVTIPEDLQASGWFWHGAILMRPPTSPRDIWLGIGADMYPPPVCFEHARMHDRSWAAYQAKKPPVQLSLFAEAT